MDGKDIGSIDDTTTYLLPYLGLCAFVMMIYLLFVDKYGQDLFNRALTYSIAFFAGVVGVYFFSSLTETSPLNVINSDVVPSIFFGFIGLAINLVLIVLFNALGVQQITSLHAITGTGEFNNLASYAIPQAIDLGASEGTMNTLRLFLENFVLNDTSYVVFLNVPSEDLFKVGLLLLFYFFFASFIYVGKKPWDKNREGDRAHKIIGGKYSRGALGFAALIVSFLFAYLHVPTAYESIAPFIVAFLSNFFVLFIIYPLGGLASIIVYHISLNLLSTSIGGGGMLSYLVLFVWFGLVLFILALSYLYEIGWLRND